VRSCLIDGEAVRCDGKVAVFALPRNRDRPREIFLYAFDLLELDGTDLRREPSIRDRALPPGEVGEILCRGDVVMCGYWQDPQASAATLKGGWLHTGDVGSFDADGYLTLKDRSKDLIISGGSNIYPREVEEVLLAHPRVREVSVIGRPDREWGEVVLAYVVGEASAGELDALCLSRIARFKRPRDYVFIDALPKSNYGKILKTELRMLDAKRGRSDG
jgi:long-chain acyl-CoA synthetase